MKSVTRATALDRTRIPLLAVLVPEVRGRKVPAGMRRLDRSVGGAIERALVARDFRGARDEAVLLYGRSGAKRVLLVGVGPAKTVDRGALRRGAAIAGRRAAALGVSSLAVSASGTSVPPDVMGQVVTEGAAQGAWGFDELKGVQPDKGRPQRLEVLASADDRVEIERGRARGQAIANGQHLARRLQQLPGNHCTPTYLASVASDLAKAHGFKITLMGPKELAKAGMGALLAVAQGSQEEPRMIVLEYKGAGKAAPLCFVGKGVTFDSGGISIKPAPSMEEMKYDMSGAAAVLGLFETLGHLRPAANVVGIVPTSENLPSGSAIKPGDVVTSHFGKTIEIVNTDAEGRLMLCDALSHARSFGPECVIDIATLTGAVVIGLGHHASAVMGNDDELIAEVQGAGARAGERCWPLPLWDEYREQIRSDVADVKNIGGRPAGSITAGWFLKEFVEGYPWAHLDVAGTAYLDGDRPDIAKGPTAVGVRLFAEFVLGRSGG
jgi:leucyl aminopeptidase